MVYRVQRHATRVLQRSDPPRGFLLACWLPVAWGSAVLGPPPYPWPELRKDGGGPVIY